MFAERITVGVYPLDQVLLPKAPVGGGWHARLAETAPVLKETAVPFPLVLRGNPEGWVLAETAQRAGGALQAGLRAVVEPVAARPGLFLVRVDGKAAALASAPDWPVGAPHPSHGAAEPGTLAAYAQGSLIDTPDGPRPVESLRAGDAVTTLDNGSPLLRWVGRRRVAPVELLAHPGLRPVQFAPGTLGNSRALTVSPWQRMLIDDWRAAVYFGEDRVLVAAQALVDDQSVRVVLPPDGVDYVTLLLDRHEVLVAEGALSESFHPGDSGLLALDDAARAEIAALFPQTDLTRRRAAFPIVRNAEARALRTPG